MSRVMRFYSGSQEGASADWSTFFPDVESHLQKISAGALADEYPTPRDTPPHLSLVLAFIKLYGDAQAQLNKLTSAHLNFFFRKILGELKKSAIPDRTYVFFQLARNINRYVLPAGEQLLAGKDQKGMDVIYTTDDQLFLNHSKITKLQALQRSVSTGGSIYAFPVANSADGFGSAVEEGEGWYPFGDLRERRTSAEIGFAVVSPMLMLKEGKRRIRVSFALDKERKGASDTRLAATDLAVQFTSSKGWIPKDLVELIYDKRKLELSVELAEADAPIVLYDKAIHGYSLSYNDAPMMKVVLKDGFSFAHYTVLKSLRFTNVSITTEAEGTSSVIIRNDFGEIDSANAFQPFGPHPVRGSNFYIVLKEASYKPIDTLTIALKWKGIPESFKTYYEGYRGQTNSLVSKNEDFKVKASIRFQKKWYEIRNKSDNSGEFPLFTGDIVLDLNTVTGIQLPGNKEEDGLIRLTLSSPPDAFGHSIYPAEYAKAIIGKIENKDVPIPNEPYTPVVEDVEVSYAATDTINLGQGSRTPFHFLYVKPFGISELEKWNEPEVKNPPLISGEFYHAGSLFIGISELALPQQLSLFFEIKEVTLKDKPNPVYYYLTNDGWRPFSGSQILSDTTRGLKETGFLVLNLPDEMTSQNTSMQPGLFWLMVALEEDAASFDQIVTIRTNGVSATLQLRNNVDELQVVKVLPPDSITTLAKKSREIKQVEQPYGSFGGRAIEKDKDYFIRISEKLRHKGRAISVWDIERIILEQFPQIYKVKCIQHADRNGKTVPGAIHVIVISYIRQYHHSKVVRPFVPSSTLAAIRKYISGLMSPHIKVDVTNPDYQEIKVIAQINFNTQVDEGFYIKKMQSDLQYFLSPWTIGEGSDILLGGTLYRSSIIEFIESRPYVNFISTIRLVTGNSEIQEQAIKLNERTVLISSDTHEIESIGFEASQCQTNRGIDEMIIDINFQVQ